TPPNLVLAGAARELAGITLDFAAFLRFGLPAAAILLPACWALLVFVFHRERITLGESGLHVLRDRKAALGRLGGGELAVLIVFTLVGAAWFFREPKDLGGFSVVGLTDLWPGLTDAGIAVIGAITLFLLPGREK